MEHMILEYFNDDLIAILMEKKIVKQNKTIKTKSPYILYS